MAVKRQKLHGWQKAIYAEIENFINTNKSVLKNRVIHVSLGNGMGHSFLANYIASKIPATLICGSTSHQKQLTSKFLLHDESEIISRFEIFYALNKPDINNPTPELIELKKRFENKKLIILDESSKISQDIKDFLCNIDDCLVLFLG